MKKLLPEVCTIQYGFPFDSAKFSDSNGMPLIRIRDVVRGYSETYTTEEYKSEYIVHENDLLIGMDGEFNIAKWGKTPALLNQRVCRLAPKDSIDKDYLFYFMPIALKRIEEKTPFVTVKHLSAKELNKIEIPVLSLEEQRKIAETLSKVDKLIAFRDQQLAKLDELVKARFVEMFGDLVVGDKIQTSKKKIGEIASVTKLAGFEFTKYIQYKEHGDIIMLRGLNCKQGKLILDDVKWIDRKTSDLLPRSKLYYGDILMTYAGTIGDVAMVDENDKYHLAPNVAKVSINNKKAYNPIFLMYLFLYSNDYIMRFASQVAQASINMEKIRNFEYYFPDVNVAMVDENDKYHLAPNVAKVSINNKKAYNPIFLMYLFLYSNDYIMRFASQVAQASINMEKIRNFEYYFPDVTFQNQFATFVERVDKQKQTVQQSLEKLELMKKALMQEYFG